MNVRRVLAIGACVVSWGIAGMAGLLVFIGLWSLIASEGEPDPEWSWSAYAATMAASLFFCVAFGAVAIALGRRVSSGGDTDNGPRWPTG